MEENKPPPAPQEFTFLQQTAATIGAAMIVVTLMLGGCFVVVVGHMFTHGRRGRRWGRF